MAYIYIFFFVCLKKFEKVEKTGIISTKFSLRCTPSLILGVLLMSSNAPQYKMVFCYQNCSDLLWEIFFPEFAKFLRSLGQFIQTVKCLVTEFFLTCSCRFLISKKFEQLEFKLENNYWYNAGKVRQCSFFIYLQAIWSMTCSLQKYLHIIFLHFFRSSATMLETKKLFFNHSSHFNHFIVLFRWK